MDKEIMKVSIDNLAQKQLEFLKEHNINVLKNIISLIEEENFEKINKFVANSPAGDGYGEDNYYIDFSYEGSCKDVMEAFGEMEYIKSKIQVKK